MGSLPWSPAYARFFQTARFYKIARWQSDYLHRTSPYAQACIDALVTLVLGSGFAYQAENQALQDRLDAFLHKTKWKKRSREGYIRLLKDGEVFYRKCDDDLRFIEPDYVWHSENMGIELAPTDAETVLAYWVAGQEGHSERIEHDPKPEKQEIQHRKLALTGEKRGLSVLFSISSHLQSAEQLLTNLTRTADQQSRIAFIRKHKASQEAARELHTDIIAQSRANQARENGGISAANIGNYETYKAGTIIDTGDGSEWTSPGAAIDASKYIDVLWAVLRLCASRLSIPETILTSMEEMGAYNSSVISNSFCHKGLTVWQEKLAEWDLELFEMFGFPSDKITVVAPEIASHDANQTVAVAECLKRNKWASDETCAKMFDINLAAEIARQPDLAQKDDQEPAQQLDQGAPEEKTEPEPLDTKDQPSEANAA